MVLAVHLPSTVRLVNGRIFELMFALQFLIVFRDFCRFFIISGSAVAIFDVRIHCVCAEEKKYCAHGHGFETSKSSPLYPEF